jgi:ubiquinone/menaquinone biosynthesis C-methylase UbiE
MPDHKEIYLQEADRYQRLIDREDYQENLKTALNQIRPWDGLDVVDLGAGTGRLAVMTSRSARTVFAFDLSPHMLEVAYEKLIALGAKNWLTAAGDHRAIPLASQTVDLVLSGWSFCYLVVWEEENWKSSLHEGLDEIQRVLRPGGTTVIIETLGTGVEEPQRPDKLENYFRFLEEEGFQHQWLKTDYLFETRDEAAELTEFFFGTEMLDAIIFNPEPILPECTGIWWKV